MCCIDRRYPFLLCFLIAILSPFPAKAQGGNNAVTLNFSAESVALQPGESIDVVLVATNSSKETISNMSLFSYSTAGIEVSVTAPKETQLPESGSLPWLIRITRHEKGSAEGDLYFRLDFQRKSESAGMEYVPGVSLGKLAIKESILPGGDTQSLAVLKIDAKLDKLTEKRHRLIYASISNKSSHQMMIQTLQIRHPDFVKVETPDLSKPIQLNPYDTHVLPIKVSAMDEVQPGKHILFFEAKISWQEKGSSQTATLTAAQEFESVVLGESDIVEITKIPSLLFLPGFLTITVFIWLWKFFPKTPGLLKTTDPEYWMFSIALSLFATIIYPSLSSLFGERRDILVAYGFKDIVIVWYSSLASGAAVWLIVALTICVVRRYKRHVKAGYTFNRKDTQAEVLRKLVKNQLSLKIERGISKNNNNTVYKLTEPDEKKMFWVTPAISVNWEDKLPLSDPTYIKYTDLIGHPDDNESIQKLADMIENMDPTKANITWKHGSGPYQMASGDWLPEKSQDNKPIRDIILQE